MKKNRNIIILFLLTCLLFCNTKQKDFFNPNIIKIISEKKIYDLQLLDANPFFCQCQNKGIAILGISDLKAIYSNEFKNLAYEDFLTELLNQRLRIHCTKNLQTFKLNEEVRKSYLKMTLIEFTNFYCKKSVKSNCFILKKEYLAEEYRNTISYFFFINNYFIHFADSIGFYVICRNY